MLKSEFKLGCSPKVSNLARSPAISFSSLELISLLMTLPSDASQGIIKGPWNKKGNIAITGTFIGKKEIKKPVVV